MPKCSFCGSKLKTGTGKMFVKRDGKILYFCSKKCEKNMLKLKRNPSKVKWVTKTKKK
ncbi:50S ribosomal protein L24e [Candidatus Woesearchaeota archaeon]|nr:MAG: 50S ribosomal protein L24e [Candidatus Woesearchaeota archaeon]RLE45030.1 MAG: 50S ribosomal protein L24e [Candidatus Woesearchaeota archaeon]HDM43757.1 50S ribosomal protein L24e [Candidatus Woesearchaeota archaeon]